MVNIDVSANLDGNQQPLKQNVKIAGLSLGGDLRRGFSIGPTSDIAIANNQILGANEYGVYMNRVADVEVLGNSIISNDDVGRTLAAIYVSTVGATDLRIADNVSEGTLRHGIALFNTVNSQITNNAVSNVAGQNNINTGYGIFIYATANNDATFNNKIHRNRINDTGGRYGVRHGRIAGGRSCPNRSCRGEDWAAP